MTCRDRNINATKALLFGLQIEGIRNVLAVSYTHLAKAEAQRLHIHAESCSVFWTMILNFHIPLESVPVQRFCCRLSQNRRIVYVSREWMRLVKQGQSVCLP